MSISSGARYLRYCFFSGLLALGLCAAAVAQGHSRHAPPPQAPAGDAVLDRWRKANEAVGQFPRGHADVLGWEQRHMPTAPSATAPQGGASLSRAKAVEWALREAPGLLVRPGWSRPEREDVERKAVQRTLEVERSWVDAVISGQVLVQAQQALETAEIGAELAQRMLVVGHWSRARQMQEELPLWQARARLAQAQWVHDQNVQRLWQYLGASITLSELIAQLPQQWAEAVPQAPLELQGLQAQALRAHPRWRLEQEQADRLSAGLSGGQLQLAQELLARAVEQRGQDRAPRSEAGMVLTHAQHEALTARASADRLRRQIHADVQMAHRALQVAVRQAQLSQSELVRLAGAAEQETVWRYNGMLASTWQLLASARRRIEAVELSLQARRQAWHAHLDFQAVLAGLPYSGSVSAVAAGASPSSKAEH